jgi:ribosomal protein L3 glutamine methyltransferase
MTAELRTVRDFLRYAVTVFGEAKLAFGHGASNAVDEAAYLILEALQLPIDDINPWLDARLTASEHKRLTQLIKKRVKSRAPAAFLLKRAYVQGVPFYVDERVIVPRSYIAELLTQVPDMDGAPEEIGSVLDLCTGSGCLAILAAHTFPEADISAVDISRDALDVARINVAEHGLVNRIELFEGDLFAPLGGKRVDLIITNPPYVDAEAMAALPPEYRAEPALALAGGEDGLDIVRRILTEAPKHLTPNGALLCEIGRGREQLEADYPHLNFFWLDSEESAGEVFWITAKDLAA